MGSVFFHYVDLWSMGKVREGRLFPGCPFLQWLVATGELGGATGERAVAGYPHGSTGPLPFG